MTLREYSKKELITFYRSLAEKLEHLPSYAEINEEARRNGGPTPYVYKKAFNDLKGLREFCDLPPMKKGTTYKGLSDVTIKMYLRNLCLSSQTGGITAKDVELAHKGDKRSPSVNLIAGRTGQSFYKALEALGLVNVSPDSGHNLYQFPDLI